MRALVRFGLAGLLGLVALGLGGCAGGLGEGGDQNVGPAAPPNFNSPIYNGKLSGRVTFESGFLHYGLMSVPATGRTTGGAAALDRDRTFYKSLTARIRGSKGKKSVKVQEDGSFDFDTIRRGDYLLEVVGPKGFLASCPISLDGKSRMQVTVKVLGQNLADLDHSGDRNHLVVEKEVSYQSDLVIFRRLYPPVGDVRTYLDDGSVEVLGPDGYVKIFGSDGTVDYRFDPSFRFTDEEKEQETGQRPRKKSTDRKLPKDPLMAKVTGEHKAPLVMGIAVSGVSAARDSSQLVPGDLARLEVRVDTNGGSDIADVSAVVYSASGPPQRLTLVDDGGQEDRRADWPGLQSSLDRKKGDGVFTFPLLLDARTYRFLSACQIIVTARNVRQLAGRPASFHLYLPAAPGKMATPGTLAERVAAVRVLEHPRGSNAFRAEVTLKEPLPPKTTALFLGPGSFRRVLSAVGDGSHLTCTAAPLGLPGIYTVLLSDPAGDLFYASFRRRLDSGTVARTTVERDEPPQPVKPRPAHRAPANGGPPPDATGSSESGEETE